jgi:hypothetical protein
MYFKPNKKKPPQESPQSSIMYFYKTAVLFGFIILSVISILFCDSNSVTSDTNSDITDNLTDLTGLYLGQTPPDKTPRTFLPGIINEEVHSTTVFSLQGDEVYWTPMESGLQNIRFMKIENGFWTQPQELYLGNNNDDGEPCFSPDGNKLYFTSWRISNTNGYSYKENIWYAERTTEGWDDPVILPPVVNELDLHWSFSVSDSGNLYYAAHPMGEGETNDIYCAEFEDSSFMRRYKLDETINTAGSEDTPFIAPDESYLIFSRLPDFNSYAEIYISFKNEDGTWGEAIEMTGINTGGHEVCPHLSPDGLYLFFISSRSGKFKPYWVSADIIDDYK